MNCNCYFECPVQIHEQLYRDMIVLGEVIREFQDYYLVEFYPPFESTPKSFWFAKREVTLL